MSYTHCGYSYASSSQFLMTGQHPSAPYPTPTTMPPDTLVSQTAGSPVCSLAYDGRLLTTYPRLAVGDLYGTGYPEQAAAAGYMAGLATNPAVIYPTSLTSPYDMKDPRAAWATLPQAACYPCDPTLATYGAYGDRFDPVDSEARRRNATRETTSTLKAWLNEHRKNPYPTKGEKIMLAIITKMTLTQVSTWFANARRRLKKENKMTWEPRNKTGDDLDDVSVDEDDVKIDAKDAEEQDDEEQGKIEEERNGEDESRDKERKNDLSDDPREAPPQRPTTPPLPPTKHTPNIPESPDAREKVPPLSPCKDIKSPVDDPLTLIRPTKLGGSGTGSEKPKIWSLARTATSTSPPPIRRSPFPALSPVTGDCDDRTRLNRLIFHERMLPTDLSSSSSHRNQQRGEPADFRTRVVVHDSSAESSLSSSPLWPNNDGLMKSDRLSSERLTPFDASDVVSVSSSSSCSPSLVTSHPEAGRQTGLSSLNYNPARLIGCRLLQCGQDPTVGVDPINSALSYRSNDRYVPHAAVGATLDLRTLHSPLMRPPLGCPVNFSATAYQAATALHRTKLFQVDIDSSLGYRPPSHNGDGSFNGERDACKADAKSKTS